MKPTIENLKDSFKIGYEAYRDSRLESLAVWDLYHNRHFTREQLAVLENRGQPAETFNVVKKFSRMLVGYYSTVVNTIVAVPNTFHDTTAAQLMSDTIKSSLEENNFDVEGDKIKLGGLISGLFTCMCIPYDTGMKDEFGRVIYKLRMHYVPDSQLVLDPSSTMDDYSDARWLHRFKWLNKSQIKKLVGSAWAKVEADTNFLNVPEADKQFNYGESFVGSYRLNDSYLVVHTVWEDDDGKRWSIYWSGDKILRMDEITYRTARWPYRVQKLHDSEQKEYYGIFREVIQSQHAINQAVLKIQLLVNSEKAFVEKDAVDNMDEFTRAFNRVTGVIPVDKLSGIKIEKMSADIQAQYLIVDKALTRIQQVLGVNDSFMGMAFASDSGRKVKLQANATVMSLRYATSRLQGFYVSLGRDMIALIKQFYSAHQILRVTDELNGMRWVELNKPMTMPAGPDPTSGQQMEQPIFVPVYNPDSLEPEIDANGNVLMAPVNEQNSELAFNSYDIRVEASSYNDEDEKTQLLLETVMSGQIGVMMSKVNPSGFFKMSSLSIRTTKTRYSKDIAEILDQTSQMLQGNQQATQQAQQAAMGGGSTPNPMSRDQKLPQNTNEGAQ